MVEVEEHSENGNYVAYTDVIALKYHHMFAVNEEQRMQHACVKITR